MTTGFGFWMTFEHEGNSKMESSTAKTQEEMAGKPWKLGIASWPECTIAKSEAQWWRLKKPSKSCDYRKKKCKKRLRPVLRAPVWRGRESAIIASPLFRNFKINTENIGSF